MELSQHNATKELLHQIVDEAANSFDITNTGISLHLDQPELIAADYLRKHLAFIPPHLLPTLADIFHGIAELLSALANE